MNAPVVTPAQIIAAIGAILGLLVSLTLLDEPTAQAILAATSTLVPIALVFADAFIRKGRADALASGNVATDDNGKLYGTRAVTDAISAQSPKGSR